jgi:shikimate kinase
LSGPRQVLATGGGAYMDPDTRACIRERGIAIWLKAEHDVLLKRVKRRKDRPLLKHGDPGETLARLMTLRHPIYAEADITIETGDGPHEGVVEEIIRRLQTRVEAPAS